MNEPIRTQNSSFYNLPSGGIDKNTNKDTKISSFSENKTNFEKSEKFSEMRNKIFSISTKKLSDHKVVNLTNANLKSLNKNILDKIGTYKDFCKN